MLTEALESLTFKHLAVFWMSYGYQELGPFLKTAAIEIHGSVFGYYPMCIRPWSDYSRTWIELRNDLALTFVGT